MAPTAVWANEEKEKVAALMHIAQLRWDSGKYGKGGAAPRRCFSLIHRMNALR